MPKKLNTYISRHTNVKNIIKSKISKYFMKRKNLFAIERMTLVSK